MFPTLFNLTYFLGGIQNCVSVVGNCILNSNIPFEIPVTHDDMKYFYTNDDETKVINCYKSVFKNIGFLKIEKKLFRSKNP